MQWDFFFKVPSDAVFDDVLAPAEPILAIVPIQTFAESDCLLNMPLSVWYQVS